MQYQKAAHAYGNTQTVAVAESENRHAIILLLFDELLKSMKSFTQHMQNNPINHEKLNASYSKSLSIIYTLQSSLDMEKGGEIALNLFRVYEFARQMLLNDYRNKTVDGCPKACIYLQDIRAAWSEIGQET